MLPEERHDDCIQFVRVRGTLSEHLPQYACCPFSLMLFPFSIMYTAWCLTLDHYGINCWALSIFNSVNFTLIPFYYNHTLWSYDFHSNEATNCRQMISILKCGGYGQSNPQNSQEPYIWIVVQIRLLFE